MTLRTVFADPMVRMLVAAILLAAILPATGSARSVAQAVANAAIFILFLLNGMRIARRDIAAGIANWRFLLPLVLWVFGAMALIGAVVCLRLQRMGGNSQLLAIGSLAAVGLYFFTQFSSSLGATGAAPPVIAAWSPPLFVLFCTLTFIAYREDG